MKKKNDLLALKLKFCGLALSSAIATSLTGCGTEMSTNGDIEYSTLDQNDNDALENGVTQVIDVPNNDFKLVVNYKFDLADGEKWTITDDKDIVMEIATENLPSDMAVYIDNVHTDTKIVAHDAYYNGILQDTMDDRIHNSLMLGFPISDETSYVGSNHIEGQNDTFISGYSLGVNGTSQGTLDQKRRLESDYLEVGVYANQISSVIDLIIVDQNDEISCVSVNSDISVPVWPFVKYINKDKIYYKYYYYNGTEIETEKISEDEFQNLSNEDADQKTLNLK